MPERIIVKINENDNVAVAIHDLPAEAEFLPGLKTREPIPQAHKIALTDIPKGGEIIRYGVVLGYAKRRSRPEAGSMSSCSICPKAPSWTTCPTAPT